MALTASSVATAIETLLANPYASTTVNGMTVVFEDIGKLQRLYEFLLKKESSASVATVKARFRND
jgi:hypothetical protein